MNFHFRCGFLFRSEMTISVNNILHAQPTESVKILTSSMDERLSLLQAKGVGGLHIFLQNFTTTQQVKVTTFFFFWYRKENQVWETLSKLSRVSSFMQIRPAWLQKLIFSGIHLRTTNLQLSVEVLLKDVLRVSLIDIDIQNMFYNYIHQHFSLITPCFKYST